MSAAALFPPQVRAERLSVNGLRIFVRHTVGLNPSLPPLLLLHGFPQTHLIWHRVAPALMQRYTLVMPDLRGYGDSDKPAGAADHSTYSKRSLAQDQVALMQALGFASFFLCGHDRGARVAHRLALDHPQAVQRLMLLDIAPTLSMYEQADAEMATLYYHWFFLIQPAPLPERLIAADPCFYLHSKLGSWGSGGLDFFDPRAIAEYERCFNDPAAIHAACEDYRAGASIDLEHDRADSEQRIRCPLRVLWGEHSVIHRLYEPLGDWQHKAALPVSGRAVASGHFLPEQAPAVLTDEITGFFG